jgi:4-carboxymuconolactone decarboxylase
MRQTKVKVEQTLVSASPARISRNLAMVVYVCTAPSAGIWVVHLEKGTRNKLCSQRRDEMAESDFPKWYSKTRQQYREYFEALENLGETVRKQGPLDERTSHLIQLAAAAAIRSEGSVHSHARRAIKAGATPEEIYHTIMLLTTTIGFPTTSAALSWVYDLVGEKK